MDKEQYEREKLHDEDMRSDAEDELRDMRKIICPECGDNLMQESADCCDDCEEFEKCHSDCGCCAEMDGGDIDYGICPECHDHCQTLWATRMLEKEILKTK